METIMEQINKLTKTTEALSKAGLLIIEDNKESQRKIDEVIKSLSESRYQKCAHYVDIMNALSLGSEKIFYIENEEKLDGSVLEIIAEFEAGIVSLADKIHNTGLKTAKWNPATTSLVVVLTREQVEKSHPQLFEYVNIIQSI